MATFEPNAAAAELTAEATAARVAAAKEEENLLALRAAVEAAGADERDALAFQVRRSERIVAALQSDADAKEQEAARIRAQLTVVS